MKRLKDISTLLCFVAWLGSFAYGAVHNWGEGDHSGLPTDTPPVCVQDGQRYLSVGTSTIAPVLYTCQSGSLVAVSSGETVTSLDYTAIIGSGTGVYIFVDGAPVILPADTINGILSTDESGSMGFHTDFLWSGTSISGDPVLPAYGGTGADTSSWTGGLMVQGGTWTTHAITTEATYTASALTVSAGTLTAGTVDDLATIGSGTVQIIEATGASPILAIVEFTGVGTINNVLIRGYYDGGASHDVAIEIYSSATGTFETLGQMATASSNAWYSYDLFVSADYVSSGTSTIRFRHVQTGVATHDLYLDHVVLRNSFGGGGGVQSHSSLSGLDHPDHPFSAITGSMDVTQLPSSVMMKSMTFGFAGGGTVLSATTDTMPLLSYDTGTITRYDMSCYPSGTVSVSVYAALNSVPSATTDFVTTISTTNTTITGTTDLSTFTTTTVANGKRWVARVIGTPSGSTACSLVFRYLSGN